MSIDDYNLQHKIHTQEKKHNVSKTEVQLFELVLGEGVMEKLKNAAESPTAAGRGPCGSRQCSGGPESSQSQVVKASGP